MTRSVTQGELAGLLLAHEWLRALSLADAKHYVRAGIRARREILASGVDLAPEPLTFAAFQAMNADRCATAFAGHCDAWTLSDYAVALAGEVGEFCNLLKKMRRGDTGYQLTDSPAGAAMRKSLLDELADVITYADRLVTMLGGDTGEVVLAKFQEVSARVGYKPDGVA